MRMKKKMVGIILSGGTGSRLFPLTLGVAKSLLPIYKNPMVYYPLKTLIDLEIRDILIIVSSRLQMMLFEMYLGDGTDFGVNISYVVQDAPKGLADAFIVGATFIGDSNVTMILGDNVFILDKPIVAVPNTIFTYKVKDPSAYGVAVMDGYGELEDIVEKPEDFISENAVVGLYVFSNDVVRLAKDLCPSKRGELEIVDLIKSLMATSYVSVQEIEGVWFDCGTHDDLLECGEFIRALAKRTNRVIMLKE